MRAAAAHQDVIEIMAQNTMAQKASEMMMADAKSYTDMGVKFFDNMRAIFESSMKTSVSAATDAVKAA